MFKRIVAALFILIALSGSASPALAVNWHEGPAKHTAVNWSEGPAARPTAANWDSKPLPA
jgi:hypothetical protein